MQFYVTLIFFVLFKESWAFFESFSSISPSASCPASGCQWQSLIYFEPYAGSNSEEVVPINDTELNTKFNELIDIDEPIESIAIYSHKLYDIQLTQGLLYHSFVVLKTSKWWWTIEKNTEGITIQRSKKLRFVIDWYRRSERPSPLTLRKEGNSKATMHDLIRSLYYSGELNKTYNFLTSNCQVFANRIFDYFAMNVNNYSFFIYS